MTKNIIPSDMRQEKRMNNPGKNNIFVGSRQGGPKEASRTKQESIKHQNPEFFKRQSDRKKDSLSTMPIQRDFNKHQKNVGNDPGRGVGDKKSNDASMKGKWDPKAGRGIGEDRKRDQANFQIKQFAKSSPLETI